MTCDFLSGGSGSDSSCRMVGEKISLIALNEGDAVDLSPGHDLCAYHQREWLDFTRRKRLGPILPSSSYALPTPLLTTELVRSDGGAAHVVHRIHSMQLIRSDKDEEEEVALCQRLCSAFTRRTTCDVRRAWVHRCRD